MTRKKVIIGGLVVVVIAAMVWANLTRWRMPVE